MNATWWRAIASDFQLHVDDYEFGCAARAARPTRRSASPHCTAPTSQHRSTTRATSYARKVTRAARGLCAHEALRCRTLASCSKSTQFLFKEPTAELSRGTSPPRATRDPARAHAHIRTSRAAPSRTAPPDAILPSHATPRGGGGSPLPCPPRAQPSGARWAARATRTSRRSSCRAGASPSARAP